jgi:5-(carboxyamino)imidazole ribonucleotide synthase
LSYVGVMTVELFEVDGRLLVNEVAMRVHDSGHWTIEAAPASQFENHLRAICGWPLGLTHPLGHAAMLNLIGHVPPRPSLLAIPGAHVHLYGKDGRPNRKVGHVTVTASSASELETRLRELESRVGAMA